jgi:methylated-DNA-[protein]-cysteine S-methyltransferase
MVLWYHVQLFLASGTTLCYNDFKRRTDVAFICFLSLKGAFVMDAICTLSSPMGPLHLAADGTALTGLWMEGQKYFAATLTGREQTVELPVFDETRRWLDAYFAGETPGPLPLLAPRGSAFRQEVWKLLLKIPRGETTTYGALAECLRARGVAASAQAVGGAVGHNPISILIPCHRVVGSGGSLTGYAGGLDKKRMLLELEGADLSGLYTPVKLEKTR